MEWEEQIFNTFLQMKLFNISSKVLETLKPKSFKFLMIKKKISFIAENGARRERKVVKGCDTSPWKSVKRFRGKEWRHIMKWRTNWWQNSVTHETWPRPLIRYKSVTYSHIYNFLTGCKYVLSVLREMMYLNLLYISYLHSLSAFF